jgi:glycosyltransferase involved in cell wall biosynthesis
MSRRVLFLAWAPFFSGAERALLMTLRALDGSEYEPYVIAGTDGEFAAAVRALGVDCEVTALSPLEARRPFAGAFSVAKIVAAARRCGAALVHANDMPSYQPGGYAARLLGIPAITHLRFPDTQDGYRWFLRPDFARAIFISEAFKADAIREAPGVFDDRAAVLYDAVELPTLWTVAERQAERSRLGLPADRPVVALAGQVAEVKGIWEFVDAADRLRDTDAVFAVLGDDLKTGGAVRAEMEGRVRDRGLADRFVFLGFRKDAPQVVQAFDIVAVPSHVEPFGLSSLEAMAAARPVVASRVGGIPEVVADGRTGWLVPPREPRALAGAIRTLLLDPRQQAAFGAEGRKRADTVFSPLVHRRGLSHLYEQVTTCTV